MILINDNLMIKNLSEFYFFGSRHLCFMASAVATLRSSIGCHGIFGF